MVGATSTSLGLWGGTPGVLRGSGPKHVCWVLGLGYETTSVRETQREKEAR
jgi:hypothetical protein